MDIQLSSIIANILSRKESFVSSGLGLDLASACLVVAKKNRLKEPSVHQDSAFLGRNHPLPGVVGSTSKRLSQLT